MYALDYAEPWIAAIEQQVFPVLRADPRLKDADKLIARFSGNVTRWRAGGEFRPIVEDANELAAAVELLRLDASDVVIRYEPKLMNTAKSIDFSLEWPDGTRSWVDVKTVAPQWIDDGASWQRFENLEAAFPNNARLIVSRDWAGAAISGQEIKARWSFIKRTVEVEQKVGLLDASERGPVRLLFCSNGTFHKDGLEDFADFYKSRRFREDDWSGNAVTRYMADEGIVFTRSLAGFCFLERPWDAVFASELAVDVRGPAFGR
ncbi:hypothetical protein [Novosphingobium sp. Fuku2-ISO-50]|uniref:hypothetical protein n=1 Tax=Novosphingobium sp. Fuku2-ISO-50 TaxID=1739114 RepID=UPI000A61D80A|nr:hypothetical protein [Novosphingobium sp. Fuku2-ISO-50]